jgi:hypothetical protein
MGERVFRNGWTGGSDGPALAGGVASKEINHLANASLDRVISDPTNIRLANSQQQQSLATAFKK